MSTDVSEESLWEKYLILFPRRHPKKHLYSRGASNLIPGAISLEDYSDLRGAKGQHSRTDVFPIAFGAETREQVLAGNAFGENN